MKKALILIVLSTFFFNCEKIDAPNCIDDKINDIRNGHVWNPPAKIYSYTYQKQTVYYFPPRCCDIPSTLYDENCNIICSPDGGLTGGGDGKCPDFFSSRTNEKLIWEDKRN